mmetsp:Transcript_3981/g.11079  ORF Transcript_3981/g.11079 Transcript_3981/m.11079 type:complete len:255 (-) Transcript_3981:533-1297(-)
MLIGLSRANDLPVVVGRDATHVVVHRRQHRHRVFVDVNPGEDPRRLLDPRQALVDQVLGEVGEVQENVVLGFTHTAALHDFDRGCPGDDVTGREVLSRGGVALHVPLALGVEQATALPAAPLRHEASHPVDPGGVELHELGVLHGDPRPRGHGVAIARARVGRRCGEVGAAVAARSQYRVVRLEAVNVARVELQSQDAPAYAIVVHDQVQGKVLNEELALGLLGLPIERVQDGMAGPVGCRRAPRRLAALAKVQ